MPHVITRHVQSIAQSFSGTLPLFPLPNIVLLPLGVLPLHIFEPRYRTMTQEALDGERLIGMALLRPGWESDYHGRPPIHPVVCVGQVVGASRLPDGKYDIELHGMVRARVASEDSGGDYRRAQVELLPDPELDGPSDRRWRERLDVLLLQAGSAVSTPLRKAIGSASASDVPFGSILDLVAQVLPLSSPQRLAVLSALSLEDRAKVVVDYMSRGLCAAGGRTAEGFRPD